MRQRIRPWVASGLLAVGLAVGYHLIRPASRVDAVAPLVDTLRTLRSAAEVCRTDLEESTSRFEDYDRRLDSLRSRVRELESMDPRGVPADSYAVYLDAFDRYNDSVPAWGGHADTVRARWAHCRELIENHNALSDSLNRLLELQLQQSAGSRRSR